MLAQEANRHTDTNAIYLPVGFEKGQVFTPKFLANWIAELVQEHLEEEWFGDVLDPACGDGELLEAFSEIFPNSRLHGLDIDASAVQAASMRLTDSAKVEVADMLSINFSGRCYESQTFGALVSNPPWGADLLHSRSSLKKLGYSLANGQFDSWSLFVEASLNVLRPDGVAAFILPDAIFSPEHSATRAFIAKNFSIELIARLGEGIFKGVYRGTTVLLVRKCEPLTNQLVEVFRLTKSDRPSVISGHMNLQEARLRGRHFVPQKRFVSDARTRWDIDVRTSDQKVLDRMESKGGNWSDLIVSGRGVELSKKGLVKMCTSCGYATPVPTRPRSITCTGCGNIAKSDEMPTETIVVNEPKSIAGFMPLIVGEDIGRYGLSCTRQIKLEVPGINYKNQNLYQQERLLVRKTGVGLKATVTKKVAASNQVVFHYIPRSKELGFILYYILGVLSSRTMFAYHLRKSGENEWRSHPYVTPKSLAALPIPVPDIGTQAWNQAVEIASRVKKHLQYQGRNRKLDLEIEGLVAGLYGFGQADLLWVKDVIDDSQSLEPMRVLGEFEASSVPIEMVP